MCCIEDVITGNKSKLKKKKDIINAICQTAFKFSCENPEDFKQNNPGSDDTPLDIGSRLINVVSLNFNSKMIFDITFS